MFPIEVTWSLPSEDSSGNSATWVDTVVRPGIEGEYTVHAVLIDHRDMKPKTLPIQFVDMTHGFAIGEDDEAPHSTARPIILNGRRITTGRPTSEQT